MAGQLRSKHGAAPTNRRVARVTLSSPVSDLVELFLCKVATILPTTTATLGGGMRSMAGPRRRRPGAAPTNRRVAQMTLSSLVFDLGVYLLVAQLPTLTTTIATQDGGMHTTAGQLINRRGVAPTSRRVVQMTLSSLVLHLVVAVVALQVVPILTTTIATQGGGMHTTAGQLGSRRGAAPTNTRAAQVTRSSLVVVQQLPIPVLHQSPTPTIMIATQDGGTLTTAGQSIRRRGAAPTSRKVARVIRSTLVVENLGLSF